MRSWTPPYPPPAGAIHATASRRGPASCPSDASALAAREDGEGGRGAAEDAVDAVAEMGVEPVADAVELHHLPVDVAGGHAAVEERTGVRGGLGVGVGVGVGTPQPGNLNEPMRVCQLLPVVA